MGGDLDHETDGASDADSRPPAPEGRTHWPAQTRTIVHIDADAFFARCHEIVDPSFAAVPLVVGGDPHGRGVVATANYLARRYGIHSAMPASHALRLCPDAVFIRPDRGLYRPRSARLMEILRAELSEVIQVVSVDEAFLDCSGIDDPLGRAHAAQARIERDTSLTVSVGIATTRLCAKVASDLHKPQGFVVVPPGDEEAFLAPLSVGKIWGIGPKTVEVLTAAGIRHVCDLTAAPLAELSATLGARRARALVAMARGIDESAVVTQRQPKSWSSETTFARDEADPRRLWRELEGMALELEARLQKHDRAALTVGVKLRYRDFSTVTREYTCLHPMDEAREVAEVARGLMRRSWDRTPCA